MTAVHLRRIDDTQNMRRFYRLDMQPDLFGGFLFVRQWGRIGAQGRIVAEHFDSATLAAAHWRNTRRVRRGGATPDFSWYECRAFP